MNSFSNPEIAQIMSNADNQHCIDCLAPNPTFTSINNGVFLCENCANAHRALGKNISFVKSLINDQFSPEEIALLKIGGNSRFNVLMSEYGVTSDQNKEFKYHLKICDYYRRLLLAEFNKESNPNGYQEMLNNKPTPEIGLQIMEIVTVDSIGQAQQESEITKDAKALAGKIGDFFSFVGNTISETAHKYGIDEKLNNMKNTVAEGAKSFGDSHPSIKSGAETTYEALKTAGAMAVETANKIANSEPVKNATQAVNAKYQEVMNSETIKNLSKKAEENYISLKEKAIEKFGNNNAQPNNNQPQANA